MNFPFSCSGSLRICNTQTRITQVLGLSATYLPATGVVTAMADINVFWDVTACISVNFIDFSIETAAYVFRVPTLKT